MHEPHARYVHAQGKLCKPATVASLVVALALTGVMCKRYAASGKMMPAGMIALLSAVMSAFYVWNLMVVKPPVSGPRHA